jgi:hypothetical protein
MYYKMPSSRDFIIRVLWTTTQIFLSLCFTLYLIPNSIELESSWEVYSHPADHEFSPPLWKPKVHSHVQNSQSAGPIRSQLIPVHVLTSSFLKIHLHDVFYLCANIASGLFSSSYPTKTILILLFENAYTEVSLIQFNSFRLCQEILQKFRINSGGSKNKRGRANTN